MAPLAMKMLNSVQSACVPFQRLIGHWPQYGPALGSTLAAAIQETASAVMRQCSVTISPPEPLGALSAKRSHCSLTPRPALTSKGMAAQAGAQSGRHTAIRAVMPCRCRSQLRTASRPTTGAATALALSSSVDAAAQPSRNSHVSHHVTGVLPSKPLRAIKQHIVKLAQPSQRGCHFVNPQADFRRTCSQQHR